LLYPPGVRVIGGKLVKSLLGTGLSAALTAATLVATQPPVNPTIVEVGLTALSAPLPATVLTLEGGLVGLQNLVPFTQLQLRGDLCDPPDTCQAVDYPAWPLGQYFNEQGADRVISAIRALPDATGPVTLFGHSQGGQVIYAALRRWAADPASAPDPSSLSWVSIGNPENNFGGRAATPLPADSPYQGTEVIRQYDGWADWPTDPTNLLAVANAAVGMSSTHVFGYFDVDLNDSENIRYTPDKADGTPGNITYVFVPTPVLPLIAATGLLAPLLNPILDPVLRPIIEKGYQRPIGPVGASATPAVGPNPAAAQSAAVAQLSSVAQSARADRSAAAPQPAQVDRSAAAPDLGSAIAAAPALPDQAGAVVGHEPRQVHQRRAVGPERQGRAPRQVRADRTAD
jgi:pimeloyl-ACP methyl ester carboxylesterase